MIASNFGVRRFAFLLILVLSLFLKLSLPALAQENWIITSFDSSILIPKDGKVQVTETITADFGDIEKHGIYRTIETTDVKFKLVGVKQDGEQAIIKVTSVSGWKKVRIGDPDQTIAGRHTYEIIYEVGEVITRFDDHDEFYWDVTGNDWEVPIEKAIATVRLEGESQLENVVCYTGPFGAREWDCIASMEKGAAHFETTATLPSGYGLTIVYGFSKGLVSDPFYPEDILKPLWAIVGSLLAIAFVLRQWWKHGRDMWYRKNIILNPEAKAETKPLLAKETVVVEFDPPTLKLRGTGPPRPLRPAEVGTLIDEKVDIHDISATIVDLAVRGYLKIGEKQEGRKRIYWFEKLKEFDPPGADDLAEYEKEVLRGIFEKGETIVLLDNLKNNFYKHLDKIRNELYEQMEAEEYFVQRPDKVKVRYAWAGGGLLGLSILLLIPGFRPFWLLAPVLVSGLFLLVLSPFMPKKTAAGTEAIRRASGFKLFISKAEKYHQQFNERINRFDQFLPYAMVFGVVDKWVKVYQKLGVEPPQPGWYVAPYVFNASDFSSSMKSVGSALAATLPSTPAGAGGGSGFGGGGGFSGGGFGGGGGGGW